MRLDGKVVVVIGGTSGIGASIARACVKEGACVVASSSNPAKVQAMADEIGGVRKTLVATVDVCQSESVKILFDSVRARFGRVDVSIHCAGTHLKKPTLEVTDEEWDKVLRVNLTGLFYCCREVGRHMCKEGSGSIINIASLGAFVALSEATAYSASKAGVVGLTRNIAIEWAKFGIRANVIVPGVFQTELNAKALADPARQARILNHTAMTRFGKLEEIAGAAVYLASDESSFVTGSVLAVDGGFLSFGI